MKTIQIYEAKRNSDLTEGRGFEVLFARFDNEYAAAEAVKGASTQGTDGSVYLTQIVVFESYDEYVNSYNHDPDKGDIRGKLVWGYRKDWRGQWGYGWTDSRDAPSNDPEYKEFLRLQAKFGG